MSFLLETRRAGALCAAIAGAGLALSPAAEAQPFKIIVSYVATPPVPASVLDLALPLGFYKAAGVDVEIVRVPQTPSAIVALRNGEGDMADVATGTVLQLIAQDQMNLKGVVSADKALPFIIAAKRAIATPRQLDGKSFGIASIGSTDYIVSRIVLAKLGVDLDSLQFVPIGSPPVRAQSLLGNRVDATSFSIGVWTTIPDRSSLRVLVDQASYYKAAPYVTQFDVVTADAIAKKPRQIQAVVRAIMMASRAFAADPEKWVDAMIVARPDLKRADLEALAPAYRADWSVNGGLNLADLAFTTKTLYADPEWKTLRRVPPREWVDTSFVDKVLAESGTMPNIDPVGR